MGNYDKIHPMENWKNKPTHAPKYPIYIISKGRSESRLTARTLKYMGVPFMIAVEQHEYDLYAKYIPEEQILPLPWSNHGQGSTPARNFCWNHSMHHGYDRHWLQDDNCRGLYKFHKNRKIFVNTGTIYRCMEDFTDRYENVAISGPQYDYFCVGSSKYPPYTLNTRVFSCLLIKNDIALGQNGGHMWRAIYNEDVVLCLDVLKDNYCIIQFNAFLQGKTPTQQMSGGNSQELYGMGSSDNGEGTKIKSQCLVDIHPDVASMKWRFNRWHHYVDYGPFRDNLLIKKKGIIIPEKDPYNFRIKRVKDSFIKNVV